MPGFFAGLFFAIIDAVKVYIKGTGMKKNFKKHPLRIFFSYFAPHKKYAVTDLICALLVAAIDLAFPYVSKYCMDTHLPNKAYSVFFIVMAIIAAAFIIKALLYYTMTVLGHRMGVLIEADMREDVFSHMQSLSFSFYDKHRTGALMSRITTDLFDITELAHHGPENLLICSLTFIGAIIVMFTIQWKLALLMLVIVPILMAFTMLQRKGMKEANVEVKKKTAEINSAIENGISGIRTAKAFANEETENKKFSHFNGLFKSAKTVFYQAMGRYMSGMELTVGIMHTAVIAFGGFLIMREEMNYIDLLTFSLYVATFISPIRKMVLFMEQYMQGSAGFARFLEIMRTEPEIKDAPDAEELKDVKGHIEYKDVSFYYTRDVDILKNINIDISPGESFALVGPSGGGKTTLCHLLTRFYDVCSGIISVDGKDIRNVTQKSLRRSIGIIQQDVFMFAGTIMENIRYGRPDATDEEVINAAKLAKIHDEIISMPDGYDSYIGERGVKLSGGQKQRVSIARVFLKNPPILILDEATSALDSVTEQKIQESLSNLSAGRTTIIIAHRLSTIRNADRIAVVDTQKIVECGSHDELMALNGVYAELSRAQSDG